MEFEMAISMAVPLFSFLFYCALLVISLNSSQSKVSKIFRGYLWLMLLWSVSSFMMRTDIFPGPLVWNRLMLLGMAGVPFVFFHFSQEILGRADSLLVKSGYGIYFLLMVANFSGFIVKDAFVTDGLFTYTLGPLATAFALIAGFYTLFSAIMLIREGFENPVSFWSNRLLYPSIGAVLMLAGSVLNLFPEVGKYPLDITTNTINAFLLAYVIYRYRFLNLTITIRKGLVYTVLTVMLTGSYLLTVYLLEKVIRINVGYTAFAISLIMAAVIALVFDPVKNQLWVLVDKVMFGEKYDYRKTLKEFSYLKTSIIDLDLLTMSTLELLTKALQIQSSALLLMDHENNYSVNASVNIDKSLAKAVRIDKTSPIIRRLTQHNAILTWEEIETVPEFQGLWEREKEDLRELKVFLLVGIRMQGELIGLLLLPSKISEDPYTDDDRQLLLTLANEAAVVINNARIYSEVKRQAIKDGLTKLYNYRFFQEFMDKETARCSRTGYGFAVIYLDLDFFKAYNDIFGHLAGDEALVKVGQSIINSVRPSDIAARCGGDEFAIILPGADAISAVAVAERVRDAVQGHFPGAGSGCELLTISQGIACYPEHGQNKHQILSCADRALYQAKELGRNRVCVYSIEGGINAPPLSNGPVAEVERDFFRKQVEDAYLSVIYALAAAINARDNYTYRHSEMVTQYSVCLAEALGLPEEQKKIVRYAAMLHDIGKIGIAEYILNKPDVLTKEEREIIQSHVVIAEAIVSQTPYLRGLAPIILHHHEAYDGKGYPGGLVGEAIPLEARILAIADSYDAMTSDRPYRKAISGETAINEMKNLAGKQFDPDLLPVFIRMLEKVFLNKQEEFPNNSRNRRIC